MRSSKSCISLAALLLALLPTATAGRAQTRARPALDEELVARLTAQDAPILTRLDPELAYPAGRALATLRADGWPARLASGRRTLAAQRDGFVAGHSKTLRSKHLCGKAVDFKLHPHRFPPVDHAFWDAKDRAVHALGLRTLDVPSFRDRPHAELPSTCDWDALGLGPVGRWRHQARDGSVYLMAIERVAGSYRGEVTVRRDDGSAERRLVTDVEVEYAYEGERNDREAVHLRFVEVQPDGRRRARRMIVSTLTSPASGYARADWRALTASRGARFARVTP